MIALKVFCNVLKLPKPTVVDSGKGLHVYWALTAPITPDQWKHTATKLKQECNRLNVLLHADPSRTSDIASILRLPDTKNYKTDPALDVKLIAIGTSIDYEDFNNLLGSGDQPLTNPSNNTKNLN